MKSFQEFKGQSTRLDYDRERGEFVARPEPHPFVVRKDTREGSLAGVQLSEPSSAASELNACC